MARIDDRWARVLRNKAAAAWQKLARVAPSRPHRARSTIEPVKTRKKIAVFAATPLERKAQRPPGWIEPSIAGPTVILRI